MTDAHEKYHMSTPDKIKFYFMSLWVLFVMIFVLTISPVSFFEDICAFNFYGLLTHNWLAILSFILAIAGWVIALGETVKWDRRSKLPYQIKSIKSENYEYMVFLTTCIVPLVFIDFDKLRYVLVVAVLLAIIGFICIRTDLYYGNPTLALMGYRLYRAEIKGVDAPNGVILISKDRLSSDSWISWTPVDQYVWLVKVN